MTTELRGRAIELRIDGMVLTGNRIAFDIEKTLKPDPNKAEIKIWNLTNDQRSALSNSKAPQVRLAAGYRDGVTQIFFGALVYVIHEIDGGDIITTITSGDGIEEYQKRRVRFSFGAKVQTGTVLDTLVSALGLKRGNTDKFVSRLKIGVKGQIYLQGGVFAGSAAAELTHLCRSANLEWSIQDGAIQLLDRNKALDAFAIKLDSTSGLVGSPSISTAKKTADEVSGQCLILPDFFPGRQIDLESRFIRCRARLEKVSYKGDTHGQDWYCEFEAKTFTPDPIARGALSAATKRALKK